MSAAADESRTGIEGARKMGIEGQESRALAEKTIGTGAEEVERFEMVTTAWFSWLKKCLPSLRQPERTVKGCPTTRLQRDARF